MLLCVIDISNDTLVTLISPYIHVLLTVQWMLLSFTDISDDMFLTPISPHVCVADSSVDAVMFC
jgi:hypothetical protein